MSDHTIQPVTPQELVAQTERFFKDGYRLVQIGCTKLADHVEIHYSFDRNYEFADLKLTLADTSVEVPSISSVFGCAFLYENEIHDLFGITIKDIVLDFKGTLYRTAIQYPFAQSK